MSQPTCETCRFWSGSREPHEDGDDEDAFCRRYPPHLNSAGVAAEARWEEACSKQQGDEYDKSMAVARYSYSWVWPATQWHDWCGEHQPLAATHDPAVLSMSVGDLKISVRARKALAGEDILDGSICTVGELIGRTADDLLDRKGFGNTSLKAVRDGLAGLGLRLKGDSTPS